MPGASAASVTRIEGETKYDTADAIARIVLSTSGTDIALFASGGSWYDALSVGPVAFADKVPIYLVDPMKAELSAGARDMIAQGGIRYASLIGGVNAVSPSVERQLRNHVGTVVRKAGENWWDTAIEVATETGPWTLGFAVGSNPYAALGAGAFMGGKSAGALLLVEPGPLPASVAAYLRQPGNFGSDTPLYFFGGPQTLGLRVQRDVAGIISALPPRVP